MVVFLRKTLNTNFLTGTVLVFCVVWKASTDVSFTAAYVYTREKKLKKLNKIKGHGTGIASRIFGNGFGYSSCPMIF